MKTIKYFVYLWMAIALGLLATACNPESPACYPDDYWSIDYAELQGTPYNYEVHVFAYNDCNGETAHFMSDKAASIAFFQNYPHRFEHGQSFDNRDNYIIIE